MISSIEQLIKQNKTAFYVYDINRLKERISYIKSKLPDSVSICYAVKANTFVAGEIEADVDRYEICSPGEYDICSDLGIPSEKMVISGIYKSSEYIESLVSDNSFNGIFTVESMNQYHYLWKFSEKYKHPVKVVLRLTNNSQFGISEADIEAIISDRSSHPFVELTGLQFFSGTQKTSLKKYKREVEYLDSFLLHIKEKTDFDLKELEYGPGFPSSYFLSDNIDEAELFTFFDQQLNNMKSSPKVILELGRSIASECGRYYTHVVDIKHNGGTNYAITDSGMHHISYYGQQMAMKIPFLSVVGKTDVINEVKWVICGSICSMNDIIVKQTELPDISEGDVICFENTGAYCVTEVASTFLSREMPAVYLWRLNGEFVKVRHAYETKKLNTPQYL